MNDQLLYLIIGVLSGLVISIVVVTILNRRKAFGIIQDAEKKSSDLFHKAKEESKRVKEKRISEAKQKFSELKKQHEKEVQTREKLASEVERKAQEIEKIAQNLLEQNQKIQKDWEKKVALAEQEIQQYQQKQKECDLELDEIKNQQQELDNLQQEQRKMLETISGFSSEDAKKELVDSLKEEANMEVALYVQNAMQEAELTARQEAKKLIVSTIQRIGVEEAIENCVTVFNLESDEVKGRIIGREGRNIRALEAATGVEFIIDDTPDAITLSSFDPIRREIARMSLHKLVTDGRIHPAYIEEVVKKTTLQVEEEIIEVGNRTVIDLGINGLNPELIKCVGRMKYRSSYGQNLLQHSREVAKLCGILAAELGLDVKLAKRAGLLHDIGKVPQDAAEKPHAILGMEWAKKYGEHPDVCNAIGAHHGEIEMTSLISPIVQVCDAISGARPGARRQSLESYVQRLKDLEAAALSFDGVKNAYAIQAGRELRVVVESEKVSDERTAELSLDLSRKIQTEMTYPGQVKVTVIRETRAINVAK